MTSFYVHAALGVLCLVLFLRFNRHLYGRGTPAGGVGALEALYYLIAAVSLCLGWYFDIRYIQAYPAEAGWVHFTKMLFTNPAASSGAQDLIAANVFLFPLWTIIDGRRRGLRQPWIYFVLSLFTSLGFAMGLYLAAQERQVRQPVSQPRTDPV
ncbi:MAG: DUF2834 domain-containing protein [Proteobacteria bacterium]|nr:DUF2834 domain-containing protein [Pseudomonadota bacterium]